MMAELRVESSSFLFLCPPLFFLPFLLYTVMLSFWKYFCCVIFGILYQPVASSFFFSLFRWLLSSSHFLLCICFISPFIPSSEDDIQSHGFNLKPNLETWSARPLLNHPLYELQERSSSSGLTMLISGSLTRQETGLHFSPNLAVQPYTVALLVRTSYTMLAQVFQCFRLYISPPLKPALHLYLLPHFLYSQVMVIIELKTLYSWHFFLFNLRASILLRIYRSDPIPLQPIILTADNLKEICMYILPQLFSEFLVDG